MNEGNPYKTTAVELIVKIKRHGYSYRQIGKFLNIGYRTIYAWVNGERWPQSSLAELVYYKLKWKLEELEKIKPRGWAGKTIEEKSKGQTWKLKKTT